MADKPEPIFASDDRDALDLTEPELLTVRRFLLALVVSCILYFFMLIALASLGLGSLSLFVALVPAVWSTGKLAGVRGFKILATLAVLSFFIVNITAYALLVALQSATQGVAG
jgi:hypothetical protein